MYELAGYFIVICVTIQIIYWIITAVSAKKNAAKQTSKSWKMRLLAILAVIIMILLASNGWMGPILLPHVLVVGIVADAIALVGLVVLIWARKTLGDNWSANIALKQEHKLVTSGPYAFVRHPIYSGLALFVLAMAIYYGHMGGFIFFLIFLFGAYWKGRQEEIFLSKYFPKEYEDYKRKVKALIPFVF